MANEGESKKLQRRRALKRNIVEFEGDEENIVAEGNGSDIESVVLEDDSVGGSRKKVAKKVAGSSPGYKPEKRVRLDKNTPRGPNTVVHCNGALDSKVAGHFEESNPCSCKAGVCKAVATYIRFMVILQDEATKSTKDKLCKLIVKAGYTEIPGPSIPAASVVPGTVYEVAVRYEQEDALRVKRPTFTFPASAIILPHDRKAEDYVVLIRYRPNKGFRSSDPLEKQVKVAMRLLATVRSTIDLKILDRWISSAFVATSKAFPPAPKDTGIIGPALRIHNEKKSNYDKTKSQWKQLGTVKNPFYWHPADDTYTGINSLIANDGQEVSVSRICGNTLPSVASTGRVYFQDKGYVTASSVNHQLLWCGLTNESYVAELETNNASSYNCFFFQINMTATEEVSLQLAPCENETNSHTVTKKLHDTAPESGEPRPTHRVQPASTMKVNSTNATVNSTLSALSFGSSGTSGMDLLSQTAFDFFGMYQDASTSTFKEQYKYDPGCMTLRQVFDDWHPQEKEDVKVFNEDVKVKVGDAGRNQRKRDRQ